MFFVNGLVAIVLLAILFATISAIVISTAVAVTATLKDHMARSYCEVGDQDEKVGEMHLGIRDDQADWLFLTVEKDNDRELFRFCFTGGPLTNMLRIAAPLWKPYLVPKLVAPDGWGQRRPKQLHCYVHSIVYGCNRSSHLIVDGSNR